jgi:hypothetical protein
MRTLFLCPVKYHRAPTIPCLCRTNPHMPCAITLCFLSYWVIWLRRGPRNICSFKRCSNFGMRCTIVYHTASNTHACLFPSAPPLTNPPIWNVYGKFPWCRNNSQKCESFGVSETNVRLWFTYGSRMEQLMVGYGSPTVHLQHYTVILHLNRSCLYCFREHRMSCEWLKLGKKRRNLSSSHDMRSNEIRWVLPTTISTFDYIYVCVCRL